jgi:hypothetical protein
VMWAYAVCERSDRPLPSVRGVAAATLEMVADGPLVAVLSRHAHAPDEPALDALRAHERVVEALMADRAVLPLRLGTTWPSADGVRGALAERQEALLAALDRVRGRVELGVRARRPDADAESGSVPAGSSGREYLRARLRAGRSADSLHQPLAALAVASRCWPVLAPGELLHASYLVERPAVVGFRDAVERLQREHPDAALVCTGPWPAYSFMDGASR